MRVNLRSTAVSTSTTAHPALSRGRINLPARQASRPASTRLCALQNMQHEAFAIRSRGYGFAMPCAWLS